MKELNIIQTRLKAPKNQTNNFGGYKFRSCEDIEEAIKPLLAETHCTLVTTEEISLVGDRYYIKSTATITNEAGEKESASSFAREPLGRKGMDDAQVTGSTVSYARKYALGGLLALDDNKDPDTKAQPQTQAASADDVKNAIAEVKSAKDGKELTAIWKKYKALQKVAEFKKAVADSPVNPNKK